jgi:hypothetical protein
MITKAEAQAETWIAIADIVDAEYFRIYFDGSCHSYPDESYDDIDYEYFIGLEGDKEANLLTVFARVCVNRKTEEVTLLDYRTPDGTRMKIPIKPVRLAAEQMAPYPPRAMFE